MPGILSDRKISVRILVLNSKTKLRMYAHRACYIIFIAALLSACSGKLVDVEALSNGNHLLKSTVSTLHGATEDTARLKAEVEADKICRRDGRERSTKNIVTASDAVTGRISAEIEFSCEPKVYQR
jgi:hypothetical protein